ncbi:hypothetical protein ACFE04_010410 [Oxalis oulophora]
MKFNVTSRKLIKPSSKTTTPNNHPKSFTLSLLDQHYPPYYGAIMFFYHGHKATFTQFSESLQISLSEILIPYYPLAGRLNSMSSIDCNDQGAYFVEAQIGCTLAEFLENPNGKVVDNFLPITEPNTVPLARNCALLVQVTGFHCGGMCISVCPSHKLFDASSLCTFVKDWSALCNGIEQIDSPSFVGSSMLPPVDSLIYPLTERPTEKCAVRRFVFDASKISSLRKSTGGVSSVGLVMALILKCAISASRSKSGFSGPALSLYMVDLRKRMDPPLSENSLGNLAWGLPVLIEENESEGIELVAYKTRQVLREFYSGKASRFNGDSRFVVESIKERMEASRRSVNKISYVGSSLCGYPLYEMDFGWGKPIWSVCKSNYRNSIFLLDNNKRGDAIEAWITLDEQEMTLFESNPEILAFASVNPSVSFTAASRM